MKVCMLQFLLPLCLLLLFLNTQPLLAAKPEKVVDKQGKPLKRGVAYYVLPIGANKGGFTLGHTRNKTCPLDVIRNNNFIGSQVVFFAPGFDYIPTLTDLTIHFVNVRSICKEPKVWKISKEGAGFWFVSTGGDPKDITSKFKIEKLKGTNDIYSFKFCPSVPGALCAPVGTSVDSDGTKVMAVGDGIDEPYYVRFQKVPSTHH